MTSSETTLRGDWPREATEGASFGHGIGSSAGPARGGRETLLVGRRTFGVAVRLGKLEPKPDETFVTLHVGPSGGDGRASSLSATCPLRRCSRSEVTTLARRATPLARDERSRSLRPTRDPRLGRTDAGLARRPPVTRMPSASTHVCGSRHTRPFHRVLELRSRTTKVSSAYVTPQEPNDGCVLHRTALRALPSEPSCPCLRKSRRPTVGGRRVAGICHPPKPLHTHRLADSQPRRIARRGRVARRPDQEST